MRSTRPIRLLLGVCALAALAVAVTRPARAGHAVHPTEAAPRVVKLRSLVDHYRTITWTYQRVAKTPESPTSYSYLRSTDGAYLRWTIDRWTRRAYAAQQLALGRIDRRLGVRLPHPPALRSRLAARLRYSRRLALRLRGIYPGSVSRRYARAGAATASATLRLWQQRDALAALAVVRNALRKPTVPAWLERAFLCIHHYEGAWDADTGNGYFGGLQMDYGFMSTYGGSFLRRWGTADHWPAWAQVATAVRAYASGRGFGPWPNTARACGLL
jgi:hypothetical protein